MKQDALHDRRRAQHACRIPRRLPVKYRSNPSWECAHAGEKFSPRFSATESAVYFWRCHVTKLPRLCNSYQAKMPSAPAVDVKKQISLVISERLVG
jgi:hypothetical protein